MAPRIGPRTLSFDTQFDTDAAAGNLPQVSWITTADGYSDHSPAPICTGENYVVDKLNAIAAGPSSQWLHTIVVLTWDEWGGLYDHVAPPFVDNLGLACVPIIVISAVFGKRGDSHPGRVQFSIVKQIGRDILAVEPGESRRWRERSQHISELQPDSDFTDGDQFIESCATADQWPAGGVSAGEFRAMRYFVIALLLCGCHAYKGNPPGSPRLR